MSAKISVVCPACQKRLKVAPGLAGKTGRCPGCQSKITIPFPAEDSSSPDSTADQFPASQIEVPYSDVEVVSSPSFQEKLAHRRSQQPKRPLTRREKLQKAKKRKREKDEADAHWQTIGYGVMLILLSFFSLSVPGADRVAGGRGLARLLSRFLFFLGPYAPLIGMLMGVAGVALIVTSLKNVPKKITIPIGACASLFIVALCGSSFLMASGLLQSMAEGRPASGKQSQEHVVTAAEQMERERLVAQANERINEQMNDRAARWLGQNQGAGGNSNPIKNPFMDDSGAGNDTNGKQRDAASEDSENPFSQPMDPFSNTGNSDDNSHDPRDPFQGAAVDQARSMATSFASDFKRRSEFGKRAVMNGESLRIIESRGFRGNKSLKLGESAGSKQQGQAYYSDDELRGVVFWKDHITYLIPSLPGEVDQCISAAKPVESIYGFNLNFQGGQIVGLQIIIGSKENNTIDSANQSVGKWIGEAASDDQFKTVTGGGSPVHGFVVQKRGFDIIGFQLIVKE